MRKRYIGALLAAAAVTGGFAGLVSTPPASRAATPACQAAGSGMVCASWATAAGGLDADAWKRVAASGTPVRLWAQSAADPAEDFEAIQVASSDTGLYAGLADKLPLTAGSTVMLEYAPEGVLSGYCISIITSAPGTPAALRPCDTASVSNPTYNQYQVYIEVPAADADGTYDAFESVLTGYALTAGRRGAAGSAVISAAVATPELAAAQLWEPNG